MTSLAYRLYIDGGWQDSDGDAVLTVLNPATEEVIGTVPDATEGDVNRAVIAARRAFDDGPWPAFSPRERAALVLRMAMAERVLLQFPGELGPPARSEHRPQAGPARTAGRRPRVGAAVHGRPARPVSEPEDIAAAVAWVASDEARHVTGIQLPVDLGRTNR